MYCTGKENVSNGKTSDRSSSRESDRENDMNRINQQQVLITFSRSDTITEKLSSQIKTQAESGEQQTDRLLESISKVKKIIEQSQEEKNESRGVTPLKRQDCSPQLNADLLIKITKTRRNLSTGDIRKYLRKNSLLMQPQGQSRGSSLDSSQHVQTPVRSQSRSALRDFVDQSKSKLQQTQILPRSSEYASSLGVPLQNKREMRSETNKNCKQITIVSSRIVAKKPPKAQIVRIQDKEKQQKYQTQQKSTKQRKFFCSEKPLERKKLEFHHPRQAYLSLSSRFSTVKIKERESIATSSTKSKLGKFLNPGNRII